MNKTKRAMIVLLAALASSSVPIGAQTTGSAQSQAGPSEPQSSFTPPPAVKRSAEIFNINSDAGLEYRIFLSKPNVPVPTEGFPIIYVLDGNAWFGVANEIARLSDGRTPVVVVGIGYPSATLLDNERRIWDFTELTDWKTLPSANLHRNTGGATHFLQFIEEKLKPHVAGLVKVNPKNQALFGHSLGGLFTIYAMFNRPQSFRTFIASSPSIWWGGKAVLKHEAAFLAKRGGISPRVFLTAGEYEQKPDPQLEAKLRKIFAAAPQLLQGRSVEEAAAAMKANLGRSTMVADAMDLSDRLRSAGLVSNKYEFAGEDHNSVLVPALHRGLAFALAD